MQQKVNNTKLYTHTYRFNGHFPEKPTLAGCPLITSGVEASFLRVGCPYQPTV